MSQQTLKELLKPLFIFDGSRLYFDKQNRFLIQLLGNDPFNSTTEEIKSIENFITTALNEKRERDFGEPLRWIPKDSKKNKPLIYNICPKCDTTVTSTDIWNYCPHCGQRLLPPEAEL